MIEAISGTTEPPVKPKLRGVVHQYAALVAVGLAVPLILVAPGGRATVAAAIYAASVCALFATSATYHRVNWSTAGARRWMRRLDHSMIFVLLAGSYTPFALLSLHGTLATVVLAVVWGGALGGVALKLAWIDAPDRLTAVIYVALGWVSLAAFPQLLDVLGVVATALLGLGGVLYTIGAVVYARQRPDPVPSVFGYHEVFHVLVVVAAALQYAVVAFFVIPGAGS